MTRRPAHLVLADGSVFIGEAFGAEPEDGVSVGEVVFHTGMSGYQEILTDPSYAGQIVSFTYPHIGNYGVNEEDVEARKPFCSGIVVRELARMHSNWRSNGDLASYMEDNGIAGITGVDTRRLTRIIRDHGSVGGAFGTASVEDLHDAAETKEPLDGQDLVKGVTCAEPYEVPSTGADRLIVAYDFGIKSTMLRHLSELGRVRVVPASTPAADVLAMDPTGVFLSNGPGDPEPVDYAQAAISEMLEQVPIFGICLGHQLLSLALGAETYRLPFGHHGANHPVQHLGNGGIEITSQNHNFAVAAEGVPGVEITHRNLNDGVVEGIRSTEAPAFSVQYHPEAGPGPHDARYLFGEFAELMDASSKAGVN